MTHSLATRLRLFWSHVDRSGPNECWVWTGRRDRKGYGTYSSRRERAAHRISYLLTVGPIPAGMQLDHLCRNRACVNPAHLEPVTCRENLLRGDTFNARNARATHCPQHHPYDDANTYITPDGRRDCRECRREAARRYRARAVA